MRRKVPFCPSFEHERGLEIEKRVQVESINGVHVPTVVEFDSSKLDLGSAEYFDLENMLRSGVKPGVARPHDLPIVDAVESANAYSAVVEQAEIVET